MLFHLATRSVLRTESVAFQGLHFVTSNLMFINSYMVELILLYYMNYYYYYYHHHHHHHHHHRISHFSALAGKYSPILVCGNQQDQARWSYLQFRTFLTIEHVLRITDFCICVYVFGCKSSLLRLCDSDFGITPVDDITIGIT